MRDIRRQASSKRTLVASYGGQELESAVLYFEDCIMRDIKESQLTEACRDTSQFQNWNTNTIVGIRLISQGEENLQIFL